MMLFGDDYGREAMLGRRDAYWASGGSAITNSLLLSAVWVMGAVFADQNALALGGILNQQRVGNSTSGDKCSSVFQTGGKQLFGAAHTLILLLGRNSKSHRNLILRK